MQWIELRACPACQEPASAKIGKLRAKYYSFGGSRRPMPRGGVALHRCVTCGLVFKAVVPAPQELTDATSDAEGSLWGGNYDYADEIACLEALDLVGADILDVGAAGGEWLAALPAGGRRSALDIVRFNRLDTAGGGEFIEGFLDSSELMWSGRPYDVITAFDIFEHLYDPSAALGNCRSMLKPSGWLVIETGDADAMRRRPGDWPYLNLF
ncbi:class I SAM-dependent methyltransferase [Phenylobacterium sp. J367]|nr:class I SAM-dependent methyltransferase [Phenylobacterium sp. J367]MCR5876928.1 class I SAM-dependent methyltransferase [Phenylobacterium sp. J367]